MIYQMAKILLCGKYAVSLRKFIKRLKPIMNKIISVLSVLAVVVLSLSSCADSYSISGTSLQSIYDSKTAVLEYHKGEELIKIDSCEIVHGKFSMTGTLDSVMCVLLDMGNVSLPVVLEKGDIVVEFKNSVMKVQGTPLNDKLYKFLTSRDSLTMQLMELPRRETEMIFSGVPHDEILRQLGEDEADLRSELDKLETNFIVDNFDNVLGLTWFLELCDAAYQRFGYVTTTPQIDEIYGRAPEEFRNNPSVKEYMGAVK